MVDSGNLYRYTQISGPIGRFQAIKPREMCRPSCIFLPSFINSSPIVHHPFSHHSSSPLFTESSPAAKSTTMRLVTTLSAMAAALVLGTTAAPTSHGSLVPHQLQARDPMLSSPVREGLARQHSTPPVRGRPDSGKMKPCPPGSTTPRKSSTTRRKSRTPGALSGGQTGGQTSDPEPDSLTKIWKESDAKDKALLCFAVPYVAVMKTFGVDPTFRLGEK